MKTDKYKFLGMYGETAGHDAAASARQASTRSRRSSKPAAR